MPNATDKANHKKTRYYYRHLGDFRTELRQAIAPDMLRNLHRPNAWKHFAIVLRQVALAALAILLISLYDTILIWLPCSFVLGFIIFDFTVLLHEAIHKCIFRNPSPRRKWNPILGTIYATLSGLSKTQFTRWHLDHHAELGTWDDDPKRAHLTPKINKRWYKFLYMTPALFPLYFRAAAKEVTGYPKSLQKQIRKERMLTIGFHAVLMISLLYAFGFILFLKLYAIPYFFVFPIAFTINRVGQHYNINPRDIAQWTTLVKGHWFWDRAFLFSNYHLEHHYFPAIPCYNLPKLQKLLHPLYERHGMAYHTYGEILYGWFIKNHAPHTDWSQPHQPNQPTGKEEVPASDLLFP